MLIQQFSSTGIEKRLEKLQSKQDSIEVFLPWDGIISLSNNDPWVRTKNFDRKRSRKI
ncbi:hypothetical protein LEP1GSC047_2893 [Leptospira inadai serovar Lyme str. 10]|uniref:Uncharacterized protein n=1 Tax=Leptospira inadai serovar Lyme str. 10 TaxID=1049790 RepID=V6HVS8_9LEPT|nr:hypothetical protein LEP1GSC047_2893 [Leptospira inadai serovar Lyme str. 10]